MKRKAGRVKKRPPGRPKEALSGRALVCPCGGASGIVLCKQAISCLQCGRCDRACRGYGKCICLPPFRVTYQTRTYQTRAKSDSNEEGGGIEEGESKSDNNEEGGGIEDIRTDAQRRWKLFCRNISCYKEEDWDTLMKMGTQVR